MARARRGFTLVEAAALAALAAGGVGLVAPLAEARLEARKLKDATQSRAIIQSLIVFANNNADSYPLPSKVDAAGATLAGAAEGKDTTSAVYSLLIYTGFVTPELLVSPAEPNPLVTAEKGYEYTNPAGAVRPAEAIWDPKFTVDFTAPKGGHASYAHLQPSGGRLARWANTFNMEEAVVAFRGPEVVKVSPAPAAGPAPAPPVVPPAGEGPAGVLPTLAKPDSLTFRAFGGGTHWAGNVSYNDGHGEFIDEFLRPGEVVTSDRVHTYKDAGGKERPDVPFFDERDDPATLNTYLGLFVTAGSRPAAFKAVWD